MKRNEFIDVAKGGLIILVVFGHYLENLVGWNTDIGYLILSCIYAFHMPLFIFFTGLFVNKTTSTENNRKTHRDVLGELCSTNTSGIANVRKTYQDNCGWSAQVFYKDVNGKTKGKKFYFST